MIVDSSAVLAIFFEEPEAPRMAALLAAPGPKRISAANYLECAIKLDNAAEGASLELDAFLEEIARSLGRPPAGISREACDGLLTYDWPGNVRELRNTLERAAILCDGGLITLEHLTFPSAMPGIAVCRQPRAARCSRYIGSA